MRSPHVQRFDRVADGHVPIHTHHCKSEGAGEHVVVVDRHHRFAQSVPEWPKAQKDISALETSRNQRMNTYIQLKGEKGASSTLKYNFGQLIIQ